MRRMFPRMRSIYGKLLIFGLVIFCFILYIRVSQVNTNLTDHVHNSPEPYRQHVRDMRRPTAASMSPYELSIRLDLANQIEGLGKDGKIAILEGEDQKRGEQKIKEISLNEVLSQRMPYNRSLADSRHPACTRLKYDYDKMPKASVVIIFYDEPYSVLLRTIHSVLNTCHPQLLEEIILVDDGSSVMELGGKLDYYVRSRLPKDKVKILRLKTRLGLIRARLAGARIATGDALIFLDAHCEANIGWCEPLMQRILESRTSVLVPIIDVIDYKDFQYSTNGYKSFQVGGFEWSGHFDWVEVPQSEINRKKKVCKDPLPICPTYSPTMAGGLFAIERNYFWESGSYDEQMDGWGGENLEMSFRIWQCGGTIETIPCSRVGHIFRDFHPYKFPNDKDTHGINTARMALVWMDEYVNLFFMHRPDLKFHPDIGDITHRLVLRKKLRCKSFDWYMKNIFPEKFIPTKNVIGYGKIRALNSNLCLDDLSQNQDKPFNLGVYNCGQQTSKTQFLSLTKTFTLRNEYNCATVQDSDSPPHLVKMIHCSSDDEYNERWEFESNRLVHVNSGMCLDHFGLRAMDYVQVAPCDNNKQTQLWTIEHLSD